jgi:hypothetical protein
MGTTSHSINDLLNQIHADHVLVLPDLQRDFVWDEDQIRLLLDSIMRGYPFGSLLFWQTRFLEIPYRDFVADFKRGMTFTTKTKPEGKQIKMVLDGQQRLQSLYIAVHGTYEGRRLFFNVTSGGGGDKDEEDPTAPDYRFEFWRDEDTNRPKRVVRVSEVMGWSPRREDEEIDRVVASVPLEGAAAKLAAKNLRHLRRVFSQSDLVPVETIDDDVQSKEQARTIDEILEIFVRVNSGGTRLTRSDLMFSLIKSKWGGARSAFDQLLQQVNPAGLVEIDKDFVIRGLLTVADAPPSFDVANIDRHWAKMEPKFEIFAAALKNAIDFCRSSDGGIYSASLLRPVVTLIPIVYFLAQQPKGSVPDGERGRLRTVLYFLLFNGFIKGKSPDARIRYIREAFQKGDPKRVPADAILKVISIRQKHHYVKSTEEMLNEQPRLALNIAQPQIARNTLSWQERAEVDHIFPQSVYRPLHPELVDDIGNLAYLGKLRNIRKSDEEPWDYLKGCSDAELADQFMIADRKLLARDKFPEFVADRRKRMLAAVSASLGR